MKGHEQMIVQRMDEELWMQQFQGNYFHRVRAIELLRVSSIVLGDIGA